MVAGVRNGEDFSVRRGVARKFRAKVLVAIRRDFGGVGLLLHDKADVPRNVSHACGADRYGRMIAACLQTAIGLHGEGGAIAGAAAYCKGLCARRNQSKSVLICAAKLHAKVRKLLVARIRNGEGFSVRRSVARKFRAKVLVAIRRDLGGVGLCLHGKANILRNAVGHAVGADRYSRIIAARRQAKLRFHGEGGAAAYRKGCCCARCVQVKAACSCNVKLHVKVRQILATGVRNGEVLLLLRGVALYLRGKGLVIGRDIGDIHGRNRGYLFQRACIVRQHIAIVLLIENAKLIPGIHAKA